MRKSALIDISEDNQNSEIVDTAGRKVTGIEMSAAWTAGTLSFEASEDGTAANMLPVYDSAGAQIVITVAAAQVHGLTEDQTNALAAHRHVRLVSSSVQLADRQLYLLGR